MQAEWLGGNPRKVLAGVDGGSVKVEEGVGTQGH